jgi:hypothetical protein
MGLFDAIVSRGLVPAGQRGGRVLVGKRLLKIYRGGQRASRECRPISDIRGLKNIAATWSGLYQEACGKPCTEYLS